MENFIYCAVNTLSLYYFAILNEDNIHLDLFCKWMYVAFWYFLFYLQDNALHKKWSFPLRISSVNVTKSEGNCGFGHIYWRNP